MELAEETFLAPDASVEKSEVGRACRFWKGSIFSHSLAGEGVSIGDDSCVLRSRLEAHVAINRRNFVNDSEIGALTYTGVGTSIHKAMIGRFCSIASGVELGGADHDYSLVSTYTKARVKSALRGGSYVDAPHFDEFTCKIGNDVWIGAHATVIGKASIGDGAVIGAGAVVVGDVPPYSIVVGVPARVVKYRFEREMNDRLLQIAWWNWPLETILANFDLISSKPDEAILRQMELISSANAKVTRGEEHSCGA